MIVISNENQQVVQPGDSVIFTTTVITNNKCTCHRKNSASAKMTKKCTDYVVAFSANIAAATANTEVNLIMRVGGEILPETQMTETSNSANNFHNVAKMTILKNCCNDYSRITVTNNGIAPVTIAANPSLVLAELND